MTATQIAPGLTGSMRQMLHRELVKHNGDILRATVELLADLNWQGDYHGDELIPWLCANYVLMPAPQTPKAPPTTGEGGQGRGEG